MRPLASLTNRIFLAYTLLATVSIGVGVYVVSSLLRSEAEAELQRNITEAATLVDEQRATLFDNFTRTARLIADLPKFKAVVETRDPPTVMPIAEDYQQQVGADVLLVTDRAGTALASIGSPAALMDRLDASPEIEAARRGLTTMSFWTHRRGVLQVVTVPVTIGLERPELLGTLTIGYLLDDQRAAMFKALTGADIAFAIDGEVRSSTFGASAHPVLATLLPQSGVSRVVIGASEYAALVKPLPPPAGAAAAGSAVPVAIVLRSRTERMRTLSAIQTGLALIAVMTVLLAVAVSYGVARTMTRPLATITDHMRQVAATGDLTRKIELTGAGGHDEDARLLATTFNTLTESIARFQQEAAQRERLSSLGRMSTVVAHEIRNPLMIIKGSLRQLSGEGASPADIREAASDINGEIERLNRVVNEVLDFARPIRFDAAPTDVNALCRSAATAVAAAEPEPPVSVSLDPELPVIDTDGERLRIVLVNLLTNARHAVLAANGPNGNRPAVTLSTARLGARRIVIAVRDRGAGIAPDDLPRVFDPYFTTRRTGTGLGLPIAKNIVEGLGGTMTVASAAGAGTTIRVELGDMAAARA